MRFGIDAKGRDRQGMDLGAAERRPRQGGVGGAGQRGGDAETRAAETLDEIEDEVRLGAEAMDAAGEVDDDRLRRIGRHHGRVALAAVGQPLEHGRVGTRIVLAGRQFGHPRPGIGQRQPRGEALRLRPRIDRHDADRPADFFGQGKGRLRRRGARPRHPFGRQQRQIRRQIAARR